MIDFLLASVISLSILPLFFIVKAFDNNIFLWICFIALTIPTIMALINGAPFFPTPMKAVKKIVKDAKLKKGDVVYDIGCGDGRFVFEAANKYHAKAIGIELSPAVYAFAVIRKILWRSKAKIKFGDFKHYDLSDAKVIFCYLLPETLTKIEPLLSKKVKKGTKLYSYAFVMPNWKLIEKIEGDKDTNCAPILVYQKQ